jgi:hypothetical protein
MLLCFTPLLLCLKREQTCGQRHSSRASATSYRYHRKLRPNTKGTGSVAAAAAVGAYPYTPTSKVYTIPGRKGWRASTPVPPDGSTTVKLDVQLSFLPPLGATAHTVYMWSSTSRSDSNGADETVPMQVAHLVGDENVVVLPKRLVPAAAYSWRVDALVDGRIVTGANWSFVALPDAVGNLACTGSAI